MVERLPSCRPDFDLDAAYTVEREHKHLREVAGRGFRQNTSGAGGTALESAFGSSDWCNQ
jgi:hypothetical protein